MPRRLFSQLAITLLLVAHSASTAQAFLLTGYKWPQSLPNAPVTLTYSYANLFDGGLLDSNNQPVPAGVIRASIEEALSLWAAQAPLNFVEVPDAGPPPGNSEYSMVPGIPQIRFSHLFIDGFGSFKGFTYYPTSLASGIAGDVHFDDADRWNLAGSLTYPDLLGAAEHEIGHALGLDHSFDTSAVMYPTFPRMPGLGHGYLTADDIAGIQTLYGTDRGSVTPLVPEPSTIVLAATGISALVARCLRLRMGRRAR